MSSSGSRRQIAMPNNHPPAVARSPRRRSVSHSNRLWEIVTAAPATARASVRRPELVNRLIGEPRTELALVVAPPGFGKTTLLCEWADADERPFVWLAFAERAMNVPRLAARRQWRQLPALIRAARERHETFVFVIDDAHWIERSNLSTVLQAALNELPPGATIALASRTEPPLPTGRLRAHRMLLEVRADALAMAADEASQLLAAEGLEIAREQVDELVRRTEGWPAALYLAALSLRDDPEATPAFGGEHHLIHEYLRDEVLAYLPKRLIEFAVRTSVLGELSGPAADAVLEQTGSSKVIEEIARQSPLLGTVNRAYESYRWHPLMHAALAAELACDHEYERELHQRASAWYQSVGDIERAIGHAASAGNLEVVGELLFDRVVMYLTSGRKALVSSWLASFSDELIRDHGPLALCAALTCLWSGDTYGAQSWLAAAAAAGQNDHAGPKPGAFAAALEDLQAMTTRHCVEEMGKLEPMPGEQWWPLRTLLRAVSLHLSGDREGADDLLDDAGCVSGHTAPGLTVLALAERAAIEMEQKKWHLASELTDRAVILTDACGLADEPMSAIVFAAAAASRAQEGRADEAKRDLRHSASLLAALGDFVPWYGAMARILMAHAALGLADIVKARALLAEASRMARRTPDAVTFTQWFDEAWAHMDELAETSLSGPSSLTIAELRVLRFLPSHRSFREIASQLGVSANTVKTQTHAVYRKLGVASRSEAVARALEAGLLGQ